MSFKTYLLLFTTGKLELTHTNTHTKITVMYNQYMILILLVYMNFKQNTGVLVMFSTLNLHIEYSCISVVLVKKIYILILVNYIIFNYFLIMPK